MNIISVLTLKEWDMKIKCKNCGKEIEKKGTREICIKCSNIRDKELAAKRRQTKESKEYFKEYSHIRWQRRKEGR